MIKQTILSEFLRRLYKKSIRKSLLAKEKGHKKAPARRLLPIRKHREERENGIASAVPFSHFSIDAVTFDISKTPMPL